ncbi:MAG: type II toxin-antitoxin system PemK/MazF family toxin [Bernardetiaceae bacterium]|nr:type II toxin-antitoxin system PemK/MazF family toxin [Bernardetiaceae bacterium]
MKKRGEIWWVNFDPAIGQEVRKKRPAVIISNDISNKYLKRYQVLPLSSKVDKLFPSEALIKVGDNSSKAMADQLTTVSDLRFLDKIGQVSNEEMQSIQRIIRLQLDLP